jgi:hypothetical protein
LLPSKNRIAWLASIRPERWRNDSICDFILSPMLTWNCSSREAQHTIDVCAIGLKDKYDKSPIQSWLELFVDEATGLCPALCIFFLSMLKITDSTYCFVSGLLVYWLWGEKKAVLQFFERPSFLPMRDHSRRHRELQAVLSSLVNYQFEVQSPWLPKACEVCHVTLCEAFSILTCWKKRHVKLNDTLPKMTRNKRNDGHHKKSHMNATRASLKRDESFIANVSEDVRDSSVKTNELSRIEETLQWKNSLSRLQSMLSVTWPRGLLCTTSKILSVAAKTLDCHAYVDVLTRTDWSFSAAPLSPFGAHDGIGRDKIVLHGRISTGITKRIISKSRFKERNAQFGYFT